MENSRYKKKRKSQTEKYNKPNGKKNQNKNNETIQSYLYTLISITLSTSIMLLFFLIRQHPSTHRSLHSTAYEDFSASVC
jgi:hypothetical protein